MEFKTPHTGFKTCFKKEDNRIPHDQRGYPNFNFGSEYGVGSKVPVGHEGSAKGEGVPMGRVDTLKLRRK